jgi:hypothetical protein
MIDSVSRRQFVSAVGVGTVTSLTGCLFGNEDEEPDPIIVSAFNNHDEEHTLSATVTDPDGEVVVEGSATLSGETDEDIGEFVPDSPEERATYTISATMNSDASKSLEFPVGGASGTTAVTAQVTRDGVLKITRARV